MSRKAFIRQEALVEYLNEHTELSVEDLCTYFKVSEATIRRDLAELEELKKVKRIIGGVQVLPSAAPEPPIESRMGEVSYEKEIIGVAAAKLIQDGDTVFISSGSTAYQTARNITKHERLTVITNSLPVIDLISKCPKITLIALGGILRQSEQSFVGPGAEQALQGLRADKAILGVRAIHLEQGLTNDALPETQIDRLVINIASEVIVVSDHTKFDKIAPLFLAPLQSISKIVTDDIEDIKALAYKEQGIQIIRAI
ncbi:MULTISPECIES: DeoR/GlpR family DNA-binding transcription regulator [unclassified Oceanispirochaeta]|uniref:DeoR/GlpR family DNA-binding transcription regulator n=1 Tax=unclassified Oceanispirochaeta TaxID=2635722 RepID=UPI000E094E23|nr:MULTISPECIES: DeoR/GlpR family DNA-binding transcription regulator [unclassified Oceanispirochaeta]MBF9014633.1 DeoR/GlpR transcriptional regulator [Oceanispirochaeta sp. M2]NPD70889.1 DeoR/GlpR transcriptional regulator [Oceanispirochaeta sp. M1]RDG34169.1 DeoR/GlpR transcriptional regulator [Oceanispirochaeta sp. M1]